MNEISLNEILLGAILLLQFVLLILVLILWRRQNPRDISVLKSSCEDLQIAQGRLETVVREEMVINRRETGEQAREARAEAALAISKLADQFVVLERGNQQFREQLSGKLSDGLNAFAQSLVRQLNDSSASHTRESVQLRSELFAIFESFGSNLGRKLNESASLQEHHFGQFDEQLASLNSSHAAQLKMLSDSLSSHLEVLQRENAQSWLHKFAQDANAGALNGTLNGTPDGTPDGTLDGTLNERLGESFTAVAQRLELARAGLGEMRVLADGASDLNRVLGDIETRGNRGEVPLSDLLEQMLTPQQYGDSVATIPGSSERVDFAIRLPGQQDVQDESREVVWLPIDASFAQENYARLVDAHQAGDQETIEALSQQLEAKIKENARRICERFIRAPHTTDFAILFLPTESSYAEVIRRGDLVDELRREYRVTIAGPTTLASILGALQMGFRTLAIQERSREVWDTLSAVKTEFGKYGDALDAAQQKLQEASEKIDDTRTNSRAIERKLRAVETAEQDGPRLPMPSTESLKSSEDGPRAAI